jgi:hypothetical protein
MLVGATLVGSAVLCNAENPTISTPWFAKLSIPPPRAIRTHPNLAAIFSGNFNNLQFRTVPAPSRGPEKNGARERKIRPSAVRRSPQSDRDKARETWGSVRPIRISGAREFWEVLAEGEGFEPSIRFPVYTLSKRAPSAARPPLQRGYRGGRHYTLWPRKARRFAGTLRRTADATRFRTYLHLHLHLHLHPGVEPSLTSE